MLFAADSGGGSCGGNGGGSGGGGVVELYAPCPHRSLTRTGKRDGDLLADARGSEVPASRASPANH